jgi:hypothetical protein
MSLNYKVPTVQQFRSCKNTGIPLLFGDSKKPKLPNIAKNKYIVQKHVNHVKNTFRQLEEESINFGFDHGKYHGEDDSDKETFEGSAIMIQSDGEDKSKISQNDKDLRQIENNSACSVMSSSSIANSSSRRSIVLYSSKRESINTESQVSGTLINDRKELARSLNDLQSALNLYAMSEEQIAELDINDKSINLSAKYQKLKENQITKKGSFTTIKVTPIQKVQKLIKDGALKDRYISIPHQFDTAHFRVIERWKFVIRTVIKLLQGLKHPETLKEIDWNETKETAENELKLHKYLFAIVLSSKIQHYMIKKNRSERDENRLKNLLQERCDFFKNYSYEKKVRLCQYLTYHSHKAGKVVVRQNYRCRDIYFILSGQLEIMKDSLGMDGATMFGEGYLTVGGVINQDQNETIFQDVTIRSSTIICRTDCEFLSIERKDFWNIMADEDTTKDQEERAGIIRSINIFQNVDDNSMEQLCTRSQICYYSQGDRIVVSI